MDGAANDGWERGHSMAEGLFRIAIVGAAALAAKELADELEGSLLAASTVTLFDEEEAAGRVSAAGDEASVVQQVEAGSFARMDFIFFAGTEEATREHWQEAKGSGASIVDLTYELEGERGVLVRAPWVLEAMRAGKGSVAGPGQAGQPNLETAAVVAAHPAAVMLALVAARVSGKMAVKSLAATLVEPASQQGSAAMDELHQQTVNLLSFQDLPKAQYDAQVAFNLLPALGDSAKVSLLSTEERIARHYKLISGLAGGTGLPGLDLELIQAPVFHGYVASVLLELEDDCTAAQLEEALTGEWLDVVAEDSDPPSNLSAAGQEEIMVRVKRTGAAAGGVARRFWLWLAADNLKLGALNAIACANELKRLRPRGKVQ